ncbi:hypothetical protein EIP91_010599 [Steccherinum ochraceum]|uniref:GH18 domain-containing protein n=1 Tax=Steccherinum ochraceum TaxID=92696 RepID=A0A4R0R5Q5_9APHY|nr:hypothetical protein EIP91_010599 [Steccherinum ochraceum]
MVSTLLTTSTFTTFTTLAPSGGPPVVSEASPTAAAPAAVSSSSSVASPPAPSIAPPSASQNSSASDPAPTAQPQPVPPPAAPPPAPPLSNDPPPPPSSSPSDPGPGPAPSPLPVSNKQGTAPARPLVMAYYPDWATADFPPEKIDFDRVDWIDFAFAVPDAQYNFNWDGADDGGALLGRLVSAAHAKGKKVKVSIGGWTGSRYFSPATSSDATRRTLASNILALYNQYNLDGIDIDWEYPAQQGDSANAVSPNDTANYLAFLRLLRKTLPPQAKITAAAMTVPWAGPDGQPLADMSGFAKVLDWVLIMNYDTWGSSSKPGPNAALNDACHNSTQPSANAVSSVQIWTKAGFPANQLVLGVPSYGYISRSSATRLRQRRALPARRSRLGYLDDLKNAAGMRVDVTGASPSVVGEAAVPGLEGLNPLVAGSLIDALLPDLMLNKNHPGPAKASSDDSSQDDGENDGSDSDSGADTPSDDSDGSDNGDPGNDTGSNDDDNGSGDSADTGDADPSVGTSDGADADTGTVQTTAFSNGVILLTNEDGGTDDGQLQFRDLLRQGVLRYTISPAGDPASQQTYMSKPIANRFVGYEGFVRRWDACSGTPYLTGRSARQVVTYDDPQSLEMKAMFARSAGLLGVNMFDVHGDSDHWDLVDAVRRGLGIA